MQPLNVRSQSVVAAIVCAICLALASREANARIDVHARIDAALAVDDSPPVAGSYELYSDLRPQLSLTQVGSREALQLGYTLLGVVHLAGGGIDTWGNRLELTAMFEPSPRSALLLTGSLLETSLAGLTLVTPTATTTPVTAPSGTAYFLDARAHAEIAGDLSPLWRASLGSTFDTLRPLSHDVVSPLTTSYDLDSTLTLERTHLHDAGALRVRGDFIDYPDTPRRTLLVTGLTTRWRHDFDRRLSSELELGLLFVNDLATSGNKRSLIAIEPVGQLALHYVEVGYRVDLEYGRTVQSNAFLAENFLLDRVALRGSLPIPDARLHLVAAASLAWQRAALIDQPGAIDSWLVDASIFWSPRDDLQVYLRYQWIDQAGDTPSLPSLARNVILLGVIGSFGTDSRPPLATAPSVRADGSDQPVIR